jgi:hypothetical protein
MNPAKRGVVYIVWGSAIEPVLARSIKSVKRVHPELPIHVHRLESGSLRSKTCMGKITPFESTLYLDADTVVLDRLDFGFQKAEDFGLACSICEAPWMRRYGKENVDGVEYNTGVLFFAEKARVIFYRWDKLCDLPSKSSWQFAGDQGLRGLKFDDQAGFSRSVSESGINPFILPINFNVRPTFHKMCFLPIKVWHDYSEVPRFVVAENAKCSSGEKPIICVHL